MECIIGQEDMERLRVKSLDEAAWLIEFTGQNRENLEENDGTYGKGFLYPPNIECSCRKTIPGVWDVQNQQRMSGLLIASQRFCWRIGFNLRTSYEADELSGFFWVKSHCAWLAYCRPATGRLQPIRG